MVVCVACVCACLFVYSCLVSERLRLSEDVSGWKLLEDGWWTALVTEMTVLYGSFQVGHKDPLLWYSIVFPSVSGSSVWGWTNSLKGETELLVSLSRIPSCLAYYTNICVSLLREFYLFNLLLLPSAFMFLTKGVLSVNSDCPPIFCLNQSFGYHTCFSLPSKQLWLRCWPRFTVLLEQHVVLCLGFLGMVYECTHRSDQFTSLMSALPVGYKC